MAGMVSDIFVKSQDMDSIRGMLQAAFDQNKFKVTWHDTYSGIARKGNKALNILFGALCTYHEISFNIFQTDQQQVYLHLERKSSGWWGGLIGASMAKKRFREVRDLLAAYLDGQGVLEHVAGD